MTASQKTPKHVVPTNTSMTFLFILRCHDPTRAMASPFTRFLGHIIQLRTTVSRNPLDELWARHRDIYLTTHNNHKRYLFPQRDSNPNFQQASGRPRVRWDRKITCLINTYLSQSLLPNWMCTCPTGCLVAVLLAATVVYLQCTLHACKMTFIVRSQCILALALAGVKLSIGAKYQRRHDWEENNCQSSGWNKTDDCWDGIQWFYEWQILRTKNRISGSGSVVGI